MFISFYLNSILIEFSRNQHKPFLPFIELRRVLGAMEGLLALRSLVGASGSGGAGSQGAKGVKEDTGALGPKGETGPHITDKKIDMDSLLPQTLKSRFLIPDYDSSDNNDRDVVNRKYVDRKTLP